MAYGQSTTFGEEPFGRGGGPRRGSLSILPWGGALALGAVLALHAPPAAAPAVVAARPVVAATPARAKEIANPFGGLVAFDRGPVNPYGALVEVFPDPAPASPSAAPSLQASLEVAPATAAAIPQTKDAPAPPKRDAAAIDAGAPLPPLRPAEFAPRAARASAVRRAPTPDNGIARATAPPDDRNIFEKLFGLGRPPDGAVAYAAPEDHGATGAKSPPLAALDRASGSSTFARSTPSPAADNQTAVYDISAHMVYLPDGTRLEAHSGLGTKLDDPRYVAEHDRGATPPHLYELELREGLFHGVQALHLAPVGGDGQVFGRSGLLAHSYMLGPNGDSNGCVSFKDYDAFLRAYQQGRVKRLVVVARLD